MLDIDIKARTAITALRLLHLLLPFAIGCIADEAILVPSRDEQLGPERACEFVSDGVTEPRTGAQCLTSGTCAASDTCYASAADCNGDEDLVVHEVTVLECPFDSAQREFIEPPDVEPWGDCEAALRDGHSGEACAEAFTCGRVADSCCAEVASCGILYPGLPSDPAPEPSQRLVRLRVCTTDCQNVAADESAVATDCTSAQRDPETIAFGRRCSGDFVCMDGIDVRASGVARGIDYTTGVELTFCGGGIVLGRAGSAQLPSVWPLL